MGFTLIDAESLCQRWGPLPDGRGTFYCSNCGAGDLFTLIILYTGWGWQKALNEVDKILDGQGLQNSPVAPPKKVDYSEKAKRIKSIIIASKPLKKGDCASQYLINRGLKNNNQSLLFNPSLPYWENNKKLGTFPCLVAEIKNSLGKRTGIHLTYLTANGLKAPVPNNKQMRKEVEFLSGSAVQLSEAGEHLAVTEGIETALAVQQHNSIPVFATLSSTLLKNFIPPPNVKRVSIYADNDRNHVGQIAAHKLACRLLAEGVDCEVLIPPTEGTDWLDEYINQGEVM